MMYLKISVLFLFMTSMGNPGDDLNNLANDQMATDNDDDLRCVIRDDQGNKLAACWFCDCEQVAYWVEDMIASE